MAYASQSGRARTSARNPRSHAICDRCGFRYNHETLAWQVDYAGAGLVNKRILVCHRCYDTPNEQGRAIVIPADPTPTLNARPENFRADEVDYATLTPNTKDAVTGIPIPNATGMTTVSGMPMTMQPVGKPFGYTQNAQMPLVAAMKYAIVLPVISMLSAGSTIVTVTTAIAHGLSNNNQVAVRGTLVAQAAGAYSVTVTSATQFTYETQVITASGSLLTAKTLITTINMGVPLEMVQVPQAGT